MSAERSVSGVRFEDAVALLSGELDLSRAAGVRRALADDPELARAALDAVDPAALAEVAGLADGEVDSAWARFQSSLAGSAPPVVVERAAPAPSPPPAAGWLHGLFGGRPAWATATVFALGVALGGGLLGLLRAPPAPPGSGQVLVERLELAGEGGPGRGAEAPLVPAADVERLVLLLPAPSSLYGEVPSRARYELRRGDDHLDAGELAQQDEGFYALELTVASTPAGEYRIELFRGGEEAPFGTYRFALGEARP